MYVYGDHQQTTRPEDARARIQDALRRFEWSGCTDHESATDLLIEFGEYEAAVTDLLCPSVDDCDSRVAALREAGLTSGLLFAASWAGRSDEARAEARNFHREFGTVLGIDINRDLPVRVPEGFAFYSLYPEVYLQAAEKFFYSHRPAHAVCIGLRSIGTALSSVVAGRLRQLGCRVELHSLRPHGHPFARQPRIGAALRERLRSLSDVFFLVVDEGPGLSGSSLCGTAQALSHMGLADDRIVFFPSWIPDGSTLINLAARDRWERHRRFTGSFEDIWISTGRLWRVLPPHCEITDISGGNWRSLVYSSPSQYPAVHPHLERRKYLGFAKTSAATDPRGIASVSPAFIAKFAGHGRYGREKYERAGRLHAAGFSPRPVGLRHGFLILDYAPGRPMNSSPVSPRFLDTAARYLAFLRQEFPAEQSCTSPTLWDMVIENLSEGLGSGVADKVHSLRGLETEGAGGRTTAIDGRMAAHEWIADTGNHLKIDNTDHHADQFLPGCQDIAWDMAALFAEFPLKAGDRAQVLRIYGSLTGDHCIGERLPFHTLAYLAWRLGYAALARRALGESDDGKRFEILTRRYSLAARRHARKLLAAPVLQT